MRDVAYNLSCGFDPELLGAHERALIQLYCDTLNPLLQRKGLEPLSFDAAWFQYRLHIVWAIAAFVISAGASDLMDGRVARPVLERIYRAAQRVDSAGALEEVLAAEA